MPRLTLGLVIWAACSSTEPRTEPPTAPQASTAPAPSSGAERSRQPSPAGDGGLDAGPGSAPTAAAPPTEASPDLWAEVGKPGPLNRTIVLKIMPGPASAIGCRQTAGDRPCRPAEPFPVEPSDLAEIDRLWSAAVAQPPCRLTELRDGRPFVLRWRGRELAGELPGDGSPIERYYGMDCSAPHRLAEWLLRRYEARIRTHVVRPGMPD